MDVLSPSDLGIILTYRCQCACRHCLYCCGPTWEKEPMSAAELRKALEAALQFPEKPQVHLTGGEPFLCFDLLLKGAAMASELGIFAYAETSASWCTDRKEAAAKFERLRDAGLKAMLISCSPFHAEKIAASRILAAADASIDVFGPHRTMVYLPDFIKVLQIFGTEKPVPLSRYEEVLGREKARLILWQGYGIISGGRSGYGLAAFAERQPAESFSMDHCEGQVLYAHHSHFDLYGNYISGFCGGLSVGDWHELSETRSRFGNGRYPDLVAELIDRGPYGLYLLAAEKYGYSALEGGYAGKCHLCVDVRRHLHAVEGNFEELRPSGFYENLHEKKIEEPV
jgi:hypothetical protein